MQNVNEGSLQFLQAHLDKLLNSRRVSPSTVTFYVREIEKKEDSTQGEEAQDSRNTKKTLFYVALAMFYYSHLNVAKKR